MESCGVATDSVGHAAGVSEGADTLEVVDKVMSIDVVEKKAGGNKPGGGLIGACAGVDPVGGCSGGDGWFDDDVSVEDVSGEILKAAARFCKYAMLQSSSGILGGADVTDAPLSEFNDVGNRMVELKSTGERS
jgi:hypothetical protein